MILKKEKLKNFTEIILYKIDMCVLLSYYITCECIGGELK